MATVSDSPHFVNGAFKVASHHAGKSIVDVIQNFFPSGKKRRADYYFSRAEPLIEEYYERYEHEDQDTIDSELKRLTLLKEDVESFHGSIPKSLAKDYKRVAKNLFIIVERASRRVSSNSLRAQISEALRRRTTQPPPSPPPSPSRSPSPPPLPLSPPPPPPPPTGTTSISRNPFTDPPEVPSLADGSASNLDQVEMNVLESRATGESIVSLRLRGRDGRTQDITTTIPTELLSGDRTDEGGTQLAGWLAGVATATASSPELRAIVGCSETGSDVGSGR